MDIRPAAQRPSRHQLNKSFTKAAESNGFKWRIASFAESREDIDFVIWRLVGGRPVDIAAVSLKKTILRQTKKRKELWGWVEFHDKTGRPGWLFKKSTFVVFKRKNDFILLAKNDLKKWLDSGVVKWGSLAISPWDARYRIFRRKGTRESITQVKLSHAISKCRHYKWILDEGSS